MTAAPIIPSISRLLFTSIVAALLAAGCSRGGKGGITLAGSTSVEPFAERVAEIYMASHGDAKVSVQGGGSSAGIRAVQNKICEIGMSSRELTPDEQNLLEYPIALDAIALVVNAGNPVRGLTLEQARDIFAGRIINWKTVGGPDMRITPITREEGSGTRASFEEKVMTAGMHKDSTGKPVPAPFAADALVQDSNGAVREIVAADPAAVGYISFGLVDERVRALTLNKVAPGDKTIRSGKYPVVREFLFLCNGEPAGLANAFLDFTLSDSGQKVLVEEGLMKVR